MTKTIGTCLDRLYLGKGKALTKRRWKKSIGLARNRKSAGPRYRPEHETKRVQCCIHGVSKKHRCHRCSHRRQNDLPTDVR